MTATVRRFAYPIEEARQLLGGISRKGIYDLIDAGTLKTIVVSGRRLVPEKSLDACIDARLATGPGEPIRRAGPGRRAGGR